VYDRSGAQLGKEGHEYGIVEKIVLFGLLPIAVDKVGKLLKRIEADRQRQCQMQQRDVNAEQNIDILDEEVGIFKVSKQREIGRYSEHQ
jgi:hypothetical protein